MATEIVLEGFGKLNVKEGTNFPLNFNIQDLTRTESTPSSYSKDVVIIGDAEANKILGQAFDVNISDSSFNVNKKVSCNVLQDNASVFEDGYFQLLKVTKTGEAMPNGEPKIEYTGRVKSDLMTFFTSIKDKELTDLNLGGFDTYQVLNKQNVLDSFNNTVADDWKYVPMYKVDNTDKIRINEFRPGIYAKKYWDEIHNQNGWQYEFGELSDVRFDKLVIPYTGAFDADDETKDFSTYIGDNGTIQQADFGCVDDTNTNGDRLRYGVANTDLRITNTLKDNFNQYNLSTNRFTASFNSDYNFEYTINVSQVLNNPSDQNIRLYEGSQNINDLNIFLNFRYVILRANGTFDYGTVTPISGSTSLFESSDINQNGSVLVPGNQTIYTRELTFSFDVHLNAGDRMYSVKLVEGWKNMDQESRLFWGHGFPSQGNFVSVDVCSIYNISNTELTVIPDLEYNIGTPIYLQQFIPKEVSQRDFVKSIIDMYKLIVDVDPENENKLIYKTRNKYYDEGTEINWSKKLDDKKPVNLEWLVDKQPKKMKFTYKKGEDEFNKAYFNNIKDVYGEFEYDFSNDYNVGTKNHELIFSPTPIQHDQDSDLYLPSLPVGESEDLNVRILYDGGTRNGSWFLENDDSSFSNTNNTTYPYFGHLDDPVQPSYDINFGVCEYYYYNEWEFTTQNNLFNLYHRRYISQLTKGRIMTAYFKLSPVDILTMKLNAKIFINDTWWNINKVIDYNANSNSSTKVELVTVDDGLSPAPQRKRPTVKPNPTKPYLGDPYIGWGHDEKTSVNTISKGFSGDVYGENNNVSKDAEGIIIGDNNIKGGSSIILGKNSNDNGLDGKLVVGTNKTADLNYDAIIGDIQLGEDIRINNFTISDSGFDYNSNYYDAEYYEENGYYLKDGTNFNFDAEGITTNGEVKFTSEYVDPDYVDEDYIVTNSATIGFDDENIVITRLKVIYEDKAVELMNSLIFEYWTIYDITIETYEAVLNSPAITITVDGNPYIYGDTITKGSKISVTSDINAVIALKTKRL